ncbi:LexA repressor [Mycobacteroides abscessus subsp. abscessus]|uniref:LexA family protein n=1 Tax=Mycobacteroides abscessus TaxID=36809 RepID=UPI00092A67EE|nr:LexA repressor [Mycobacteroides abscessus subsp. abscessus]
MKSQYAIRRESILNFLTHYVGEYGWAPSYREICDGTGIKSTSQIPPFLDSLEADGYIRHRPRVSRAIALLY